MRSQQATKVPLAGSHSTNSTFDSHSSDNSPSPPGSPAEHRSNPFLESASTPSRVSGRILDDLIESLTPFTLSPSVRQPSTSAPTKEDSRVREEASAGQKRSGAAETGELKKKYLGTLTKLSQQERENRLLKKEKEELSKRLEETARQGRQKEMAESEANAERLTARDAEIQALHQKLQAIEQNIIAAPNNTIRSPAFSTRSSDKEPAPLNLGPAYTGGETSLKILLAREQEAHRRKARELDSLKAELVRVNNGRLGRRGSKEYVMSEIGDTMSNYEDDCRSLHEENIRLQGHIHSIERELDLERARSAARQRKCDELMAHNSDILMRWEKSEKELANSRVVVKTQDEQMRLISVLNTLNGLTDKQHKTRVEADIEAGKRKLSELQSTQRALYERLAADEKVMAEAQRGLREKEASVQELNAALTILQSKCDMLEKERASMLAEAATREEHLHSILARLRDEERKKLSAVENAAGMRDELAALHDVIAKISLHNHRPQAGKMHAGNMTSQTPVQSPPGPGAWRQRTADKNSMHTGMDASTQGKENMEAIQEQLANLVSELGGGSAMLSVASQAPRQTFEGHNPVKYI